MYSKKQNDGGKYYGATTFPMFANFLAGLSEVTHANLAHCGNASEDHMSLHDDIQIEVKFSDTSIVGPCANCGRSRFKPG